MATFTPPDEPKAVESYIDTPASTPVPFSILSVLSPINLAPGESLTHDGLPKALRRRHQRCVQSAPWNDCSVGNFREPGEDEGDDPIPIVKADPLADAGYRFYPFGWYVPVGCPRGVDFDRWWNWAKEDVEAATAYRISKQLWDGAINAAATPGDSATDSPSLRTVATVIGGYDADAMGPGDSLGVLAEYFSECNHAGGGATIHSPNALLPYLRAHNFFTKEGSKLVGPGGEDVSRGPGYQTEVGPAGTVTPNGETWIYMSGPISAAIGNTFEAANPRGLDPSLVRIEGRFNPRTGEANVIAERRAVLSFDTCCVVAVRVRIPNSTTEVG